MLFEDIFNLSKVWSDGISGAGEFFSTWYIFALVLAGMPNVLNNYKNEKKLLTFSDVWTRIQFVVGKLDMK